MPEHALPTDPAVVYGRYLPNSGLLVITAFNWGSGAGTRKSCCGRSTESVPTVPTVCYIET